MAYKFSLGKYKHSGSLVSAESLTVTSGEVSLPNGVINTDELSGSAVTAAKLATDAVETAKIKDLNVSTGKLADSAVTNVKIALGAVQSGSIAAVSIVDGHIASATITNAKLANTGSVLGSTAVVLGETILTISGLTALSASQISGGVVIGDGAGLTNLSASQLNNFTSDVRSKLSVTDTAEVDLSYSGGAFSADIRVSALSSSKFEPITFSGSVQDKMNTYLSGGDGISYSAGAIAVQTTGVVEVYGDRLRINQSLAGQGLGTTADPNAGLTKLNVTYGSSSNTAVQGNTSWNIAGGNGLTGDASGFLGSGISSSLAVGVGNGIEVSANAVAVKLSGAAGNQALVVDGNGLDLKGTIAGSRIFSNDITVEGNLYVNGGTFSASVGTLLIEDSNIVIADGAPALSASQGFTIGSGAGFATFQVGDGTTTNTAFVSSLELKASKFIGAVEGAVAETVETLSGSAVAAASIVLCNAVAGGFTVTLPTAVGKSGQFLKVKKIDNTENAVVIDANGSQTIDGDLTVTIDSPFAGLMLVSNGSNWFIF